MSQVASLGMYDSVSAQAANDQLWQAIAERLTATGVSDVPIALDRVRSLHSIWSDPELLLAQTCGYPLVTELAGRVRYVATPRYRVPGCEGWQHRSRIVVRRYEEADHLSAFRSRIAALNDGASNSGMNLFRALLTPLAAGKPFFREVVPTGSHAASAALVAKGGADIAAIDTVSFAHIDREQPDITAKLRTLVWTDLSPCLPFITRASAPDSLVRHLRRAIAGAIADARPHADTLFLDGIQILDPRRYHRLRTYERRAIAQGYPLLQ